MVGAFSSGTNIGKFSSERKQGAYMKKILFAILTVILVACSSATTNEFEKNQSLWDTANITHYRYTLTVSCFCAFMDEMPLTVEVENDQVASITSVKGTVIDSTNSLYPVVVNYATMDQLFVQLKSALADADEVSVSYDTTYGFPTSIAIDQIKDAIDDELFITVENFEVLN